MPTRTATFGQQASSENAKPIDRDTPQEILDWCHFLKFGSTKPRVSSASFPLAGAGA